MKKCTWASLPSELVAMVLELTGDVPMRYAGVCKTWRSMMDEPAFRRKISLDYTHTSADCTKVLDFATFVCARPPATESLALRMEDDEDARSIRTALAPALVHLAPTLRVLELDRQAVSEAFTMSPAARLCTQLQRLRVDVCHSLDLRPLRSLTSVELSLAKTTCVLLPDTISTCVLGASVCVPEQTISGFVQNLRSLSRLTELHLDVMDGRVDFRCSVLPESMRVLQLVGEFRVILDDGVRFGPNLKAFCLDYCSVDRPALIKFLERCTSLRGLELARLTWEGDEATGDLTHLNLSVVSLLGAPEILLPASVRKAYLGRRDLKTFLRQPASAAVQELALDLDYVDCLSDAWPASLQLPRLTAVWFMCTCMQDAAKLGQRCPSATLHSLSYIDKLYLSTVPDLRAMGVL